MYLGGIGVDHGFQLFHDILAKSTLGAGRFVPALRGQDADSAYGGAEGDSGQLPFHLGGVAEADGLADGLGVLPSVSQRKYTPQHNAKRENNKHTQKKGHLIHFNDLKHRLVSKHVLLYQVIFSTAQSGTRNWKFCLVLFWTIKI